MSTTEVEVATVENISTNKEVENETPKDSPRGKDMASDTTGSSSEEEIGHFTCEELMDAKLQYFWSSHIQPSRRDKQLLMATTIHMSEILRSLILSVFPMFAAVLFGYGIDSFYGSLPANIEIYRYAITGSICFIFFLFGLYQVFTRLRDLSVCADQLRQIMKNEQEYALRLSRIISEQSAYEYKDCQEKDDEKIEQCDDGEENIKGEPSQACGDNVCDEKDKDA